MEDPIINSKSEERLSLIKSFIFPSIFVIVLWLFKLIEVSIPFNFHKFGVFPRTLDGLVGIIGSPLIHADFPHLINNSIPLLILGATLFYFYKEIAVKIFFLIWFIGNLWLWAIARPSFHIGASGLVYGLVSFLFFSGVLRKNKPLMVVSLLVTFLYGSLVWGVLPIDYHISFEGHLMGSLAGIALAVYYKNKGPQKEEYKWEEEEEVIEEEIQISEENNEQAPGSVIVYHFKSKEDKNYE